MEREEFTKEKAIKIQTEHLKQWKTVLKPKIHKELVEFATETNDKVTDPYKIRRGTDLTNFVSCKGMSLVEP